MCGAYAWWLYVIVGTQPLCHTLGWNTNIKSHFCAGYMHDGNLSSVSCMCIEIHLQNILATFLEAQTVIMKTRWGTCYFVFDICISQLYTFSRLRWRAHFALPLSFLPLFLSFALSGFQTLFLSFSLPLSLWMYMMHT